MKKQYRYKLKFNDGTVWYKYEDCRLKFNDGTVWYKYEDNDELFDIDYAKAYIVIDLWKNTYVKHRWGSLSWPVVNSDLLEDHKPL